MEYIHKAKAEKTRTKVLTDQMEARRVKNKVRLSLHPSYMLLSKPHRHPGCPRAPRCACVGEEAGDSSCGARCARPGVNPTNPPPSLFPLHPIRPRRRTHAVPTTYPYAVSYAMRPTPVRQAHARMFYTVYDVISAAESKSR